MPFRSIAILQSWVQEFEQRSPASSGTIRVIPQDGEGGADTGLVAMRIRNSPTEIYIEPPGPSESEWSIVFEPREQPVRLGSSAVQAMGEEVSRLAFLCAFLQQKSDDFRTAHDDSAGVPDASQSL